MGIGSTIRKYRQECMECMPIPLRLEGQGRWMDDVGISWVTQQDTV